MATQVNTRSNKISVLEIIGTATRGGMENQIANLFNHFPKNRFSITCICPCESFFTTKLRQMGVEAVFVTPIEDNPDWRSIQMAMTIARQYQVDILHAHMPKSHVLAGIAGSLLSKPVVATVHGMHVTAHELGVALAVKSHLITNCQESFIQSLALGVPKERVNLFHNGVDTNIFTPDSAGEKLRAQLNLSTETMLVGFVGRLEHDKGPDLFIHAAGVIHEAMPNVHFAVVGAGSMLKQLEQMCKQMQLVDHVHFVDWSDNLRAIYPAFNLLAHTSRNDGTSLVLLEAMACGRPVVGMAVGGIREIIENERTGMLVNAGDWEAFGKQSVQLLRQPDQLSSMSEAGRKRAVTHFNVQINAQNTADLLERIALSRPVEQKAGMEVPAKAVSVNGGFINE